MGLVDVHLVRGWQDVAPPGRLWLSQRRCLVHLAQVRSAELGRLVHGGRLRWGVKEGPKKGWLLAEIGLKEVHRLS